MVVGGSEALYLAYLKPQTLANLGTGVVFTDGPFVRSRHPYLSVLDETTERVDETQRRCLLTNKDNTPLIQHPNWQVRSDRE